MKVHVVLYEVSAGGIHTLSCEDLSVVVSAYSKGQVILDFVHLIEVKFKKHCVFDLNGATGTISLAGR